MSLNVFCQKAIEKFYENPTDALFCYIQCDKELMKDYLDLLSESTISLKVINSQIAQALAKECNTKADENKKRNTEPSSTLIQGYSFFEEGQK